MLVLCWVLCCGWWAVADGLGSGAPSKVCDSMTPWHQRIPPQTSEPSYKVEAVPTRDGRVRVRISSPVGEEFQGFALQARSSSSQSQPLPGTFSVTSGVTRTVSCSPEGGEMLTHVDPSPKREVVAEWTPSQGGQEQQVFFRATVLKSFAVFWTELDSQTVRLAAGGGATVGGRTSPKKQAADVDDHLYEGCFSSKGCLGLPAGCTRQRRCRALLSYVANAEGVNFQLSGRLDTNTYAAVGLSRDTKMGDDFVSECIRRDGNEVMARESWNQGKRNEEGSLRDLDRRKYRTNFVDGVTSCTWISRLSFDFNGVHFDLENSTYLLLAEGPMEGNRKGIHRDKLSSPSVVNFTAFEEIGALGVATAIKVHGALMVTAWVGFVSLGVLSARYFKDAWPARTVCGVKVWFAIHRSFMILALTCVAIALIVIFVHYEGWNSNNLHAILGILTVVLAFLQPIGATFRPSPDSPRRPLFNWLHFSGGTLAHLLATASLFLAARMAPSGLDPATFDWPLAAFVLLYLLCHAALQGHVWKTTLKKNNEINMLNMSGGGRSVDTLHKTDDRDDQHSHFRVCLLCVFVVALIAIVISLYVLIGTA